MFNFELFKTLVTVINIKEILKSGKQKKTLNNKNDIPDNLILQTL